MIKVEFGKKDLIDRLARLTQRIGSNGMSTIEYAMMVVFIACVAVLGFELLGGSVKGLFDVANSILPK